MKQKGTLRQVLGRYLWERRIPALWMLLCLAAFGLLSWLYGLPVSATLYGVLLCALPALLGGSVCFYRYYRRWQAFSMLEEAPLNLNTPLPAPKTQMEAGYSALLKRALTDNAAALDTAKENARRQLDAYSLWTHQIKVPISAMKLLLTDGSDQRSATMQAELLKIEQYTDMALNYARLNASATDYVIREYGLDNILRPLIRRFAPLFSQKNLTLRYQPVALTVVTDEKWLLFALEQLLSNAVKYTKTGGVTIAADPERMELRISDTGVGIDPADLPRVFEQGYTGYNGRGDKRATGLGLYLCRMTLNRLGHAIRLESQVGRGTTAIVCLRRDVLTHE